MVKVTLFRENVTTFCSESSFEYFVFQFISSSQLEKRNDEFHFHQEILYWPQNFHYYLQRKCFVINILRLTYEVFSRNFNTKLPPTMKKIKFLECVRHSKYLIVCQRFGSGFEITVR